MAILILRDHLQSLHPCLFFAPFLLNAFGNFTAACTTLLCQSESAWVYTQNKKQSEDACANKTTLNIEGRIVLINRPKWLMMRVLDGYINGKMKWKKKNLCKDRTTNILQRYIMGSRLSRYVWIVIRVSTYTAL